MGWPGPCSSRILLGWGDTPIIPAQRTWGKKSITHLPRIFKIFFLIQMQRKMQLISPSVSLKFLHYAFRAKIFISQIIDLKIKKREYENKGDFNSSDFLF